MKVNCPKCEKHKPVIRAGIVRGKQRYKCKTCVYHFVANPAYVAGPELKEKAIVLYRKGKSLRDIGRKLGYSHVSVLNWVKAQPTKEKQK